MVNKILALTLPPLTLPTRLAQPLLIAGLLGLGLAIAWVPPLWLLLLLGGAGFIVLLPRYPALGLYGLILIIPLSSLAALTAGGVRIGVMEMLLALSLFAALARWLSTPPARPQPLARPYLLGPFLFLLGSLALSWLATHSLGASLVETIKWLEMLGLYLLALALLPAHHIKWLVAVMILAGLAQAGLGLYQFIFKVGPAGFLLFDGRFLRAFGTFAQPNPYAGYLGLVLPLVLSLTIWAMGNLFEKSKMLLLFLSLPLGLLLAALFASQSRGAWLAFVAAAAIILLLYQRRPAFILGLGVTLLLLVGLLAQFSQSLAAPAPAEPASSNVVIQRLLEAVAIVTITDIGQVEVTDSNFATLERLAHWQAARQMWRDHPWLGVGFGNYAVVYPAYAVGRWLDPLGHAHNYWLNLGAEAGLVGFLAYLIFWIYTFRVSWLAIYHSRGFERAVALGFLGTLVHLHVHTLFDNLYVQGMYLQVAIVLAVISQIYHHTQKHPYGKTKIIATN